MYNDTHMPSKNTILANYLNGGTIMCLLPDVLKICIYLCINIA